MIERRVTAEEWAAASVHPEVGVTYVIGAHEFISAVAARAPSVSRGSMSERCALYGDAHCRERRRQDGFRDRLQTRLRRLQRSET